MHLISSLPPHYHDKDVIEVDAEPLIDRDRLMKSMIELGYFSEAFIKAWIANAESVEQSVSNAGIFDAIEGWNFDDAQRFAQQLSDVADEHHEWQRSKHVRVMQLLVAKHRRLAQSQRQIHKPQGRPQRLWSRRHRGQLG